MRSSTGATESFESMTNDTHLLNNMHVQNKSLSLISTNSCTSENIKYDEDNRFIKVQIIFSGP